MIDRWPPKALFIVAALPFLATAILPLGWMLGKCLSGLIQDSDMAEKALLSSRQMVLLARSLEVAGLSTLMSLFIGLPVAAILAYESLPWRRLCWLMTLMPLLIPPYIMAGAWVHLLSPNSPLNKFIVAALGLSKGLSIFNTAGCAWCLGISFFPIVALVTATAIGNLDRSVLDIAELNTNRWGVFRHAVLPQLIGPILACSCLVMIFSLGRYGVPSLLGVNTYPVEIFAQFSAFYDEYAAIATSMPLLLTVVGLILFQRYLMKNRFYVSLTPKSESGATSDCTVTKRCVLFGLFWLIIAVTVLFPFGSVILNIRTFEGLYAALISTRGDIATTFILAALTSCLSLCMAYPIGGYLSRSSNLRSHAVLDVLCWIPIAVPGTILALGLLEISSIADRLLASDSYGITLLIAYTAMFCPFAIRFIEASFRQTDSNVVDIARMECQHWYQRVLFVDMPLHLKSMMAGGLVVFVFVTGELTATVLLIPPGRATLAVTIDNLLHYGANVNASALCAFQALLVIATIFMLSCLQPKSKKSV